jgi:hypothetical protein
MRAKVLLKATKTRDANMAALASLGVLAFNVLGRGGIGGAWQTEGLNSSTTFVCSTVVPTSCPIGACRTVWLQSQDCAVLNTSHILMTGKELQTSMAQIHIVAKPRSLREQQYDFVIHIPVSNGSNWHHIPIHGELSVRASADPTLSDVRLQNTVPIGDELRVEIVARDIDGFIINRSGEMISVTVQGPDGMNHTELVTFDAPTGLYSAALRTRITGPHTLFIETSGFEAAFRRAAYTVVCARGFMGCEPADGAQLIVASIIAAGIVAVLLLFALLLWKKRSRVKELLVSFASLEGLLVVEIGLEVW